MRRALIDLETGVVVASQLREGKRGAEMEHEGRLVPAAAGGAARGAQVEKIRAFLAMLKDQGGTYLKEGREYLRHAELWTFGTSDATPERLDAWSVELGKWFRPRRYVMVMEAGSRGGRWHVHCLVEATRETRFTAAEARDFWRGLDAMHPQAHVNVQQVYGDGLSAYLAKYLRKDTSGAEGMRRFRSSAGLERQVAPWKVQKKARYRLWVERVEDDE